MFRVELGWVVLLLCITIGKSATRITFPGCDRAGWKCNKVQASPIRYEIEYVCQNLDGIIFSLWNFNAPTEIKHLKIVNCSSVEVDLTCTGVGRQVESLYMKNIGVFNFTYVLYKDVAQMPEQVILENIKYMPYIPEKTFKQMKYPPASVHRCAVNTRPLEKLTFTNVKIGIIEKDAFYNLTEFRRFYWNNVTVNTMEPLSINVQMLKEQSFDIVNSTFDKLDYKSFSVRSPKILFQNSKFNELPRNVIDSTSFEFNFVNNEIKKTHSFAFILLSQNITIENNYFESLKTSAFQGIGPGLLENAFTSFGNLLFTYIFNNNTITHADIGSLHSDYIAYKNVHSSVYVANNFLPCSCKELGWISIKNGLGNEFSDMMTFNSKFLNPKNNNLCLNSPCKLPVTIMASMAIKFGMCSTHEPLQKWCKTYQPSLPNYGLNGSGKMVLQQWSNDFVVPKTNDELPSNFLEDFENYYEINFDNMKKKDTYFKIEKTSLFDVENSTKSLIEIDEPIQQISTIPDIIFEDDSSMDKNGTQYKYNIDVRNNTENSTNPTYNELKKEFEDNQKEFSKKTLEQWQAQRKKRMVYFKLYGNLMTLD